MRVQGWELLLNDYIQKVAHVTFEWGVCDCLIFASDAAVIISGKDPMSRKLKGDPDTIRGKYKTKEEARKLIRQYRKSTPAIMDVHFDRINPNFSQRGDIVAANVNGLAFGVCWSGKAFFKTEKNGYTALNLSECKYAWRVY